MPPPISACVRPSGDRIRVYSLWPEDEHLDLPGFEHDGDERLSFRDVEPDEAVAAAQAVLDAHSAGAERPLFIHLGN